MWKGGCSHELECTLFWCLRLHASVSMNEWSGLSPLRSPPPPLSENFPVLHSATQTLEHVDNDGRLVYTHSLELFRSVTGVDSMTILSFKICRDLYALLCLFCSTHASRFFQLGVRLLDYVSVIVSLVH